jgi:hypothetical protein
MRNPESHTNKDFTVEDLLTRGWTLTLFERFLEPEDYRNPVDHLRNYAGKKMYQRRRVELTEASAEFEAAFVLSARRRRLPPEKIDATCMRIQEFRENRDQLREANIRVLSQEEIVFRKMPSCSSTSRRPSGLTGYKSQLTTSLPSYYLLIIVSRIYRTRTLRNVPSSNSSRSSSHSSSAQSNN